MTMDQSCRSCGGSGEVCSMFCDSNDPTIDAHPHHVPCPECSHTRPTDREFIDPAMGIQSLCFERFPVVMNGWTVPHLEARQLEGEVLLSLDHRFGLEINERTTPGMIVWFVANAIAVAKGYACHPTKNGWDDEDRINPPSNPRWPWAHLANGDFLTDDLDPTTEEE